MHKYTAPRWARLIYDVAGRLGEDFGGGLGITWMIAGDCQKYFSLKYRKGLITDGVFRYTRNPNASMHFKDESISRYPEWDDYAATSNRLIPLRLPLAAFSGAGDQKA